MVLEEPRPMSVDDIPESCGINNLLYCSGDKKIMYHEASDLCWCSPQSTYDEDGELVLCVHQRIT